MYDLLTYIYHIFAVLYVIKDSELNFVKLK